MNRIVVADASPAVAGALRGFLEGKYEVRAARDEDETPDPFDQSPEDPFLPASTPDIRQSPRESRALAPYDVQLDHSEHESEEGEESQLFPGSDLF